MKRIPNPDFKVLGYAIRQKALPDRSGQKLGPAFDRAYRPDKFDHVKNEEAARAAGADPQNGYRRCFQ